MKVITIDGNEIHVLPKNIVGICHSPLHPGKLTKKLLEQHGCIEKGCPRFEKNEDSTYWYALENAQRHREKIKAKKLRQKATEMEQETSAQKVAEILQACIADIDYEMEIVRVEKMKKDAYKVFYVSENPFADGNRFPELLATAKIKHPSWRLSLRHIKGADGHFVTRDEYRAAKKIR